MQLREKFRRKKRARQPEAEERTVPASGGLPKAVWETSGSPPARIRRGTQQGRELSFFMKNFTLKFVLTVVLGWSLAFAAEAQTLRGGVKTAKGEPVIGAAVVVEGTSLGFSTNVDGSFELKVPDAQKAVLVVSYIGMKTQRVPVAGKTQIDVVMEEDNTTLEDVVVIGYQTVRRKDLTGSVSSVSAKEIVSAPVANVAQALQGKLPGVNVTTQDGRPDAEISIRVRGGGSISQSNDPLVLIDGIPGSLSDIPSEQVQSIDVLKDASSTAIYGARGANGVILVTTKNAEEGRISVTYSGYAKFNHPTKYLDALGPYDYLVNAWGRAKIMGDGYAEPFEKLYGIGRYAVGDGIEAYRKIGKYDMQKDVYNESFSHNHDITVSGGTEKTKIYFSANWMDEQGMKLNSYSKRASVSLKINQQLAKNLDFSLDTRYTDTERMGNEGTTNGSGSIMSYAYRYRPIATSDIRGDLSALEEGNLEMYGRHSQWDRYSPRARIADREPLSLRQSVRAAATLNWRIIEGLVFNTNLSLNRTWNQTKDWTGAVYNEYLDAEGNKTYAGNAEYEKGDSWGMRWSNTLNYNFELGKNHRFSILAGQEVTDSGGTSLRVTASYFPSNFTKDNAFAMINQYDPEKGKSQAISSESLPERILSFFGRVNYTLLDRYLFTFTMRADGSSKFAPSHRWGYFPAAAFAWRLSEEPFLKNAEWLDQLKLRLSYGQVGNDGINSSLWSQTWSAESDSRQEYIIGNAYLPSYKYSASQMANPDLKWETTITRNIGIDFGFWNNRLSGTIDAYWNTTKDLLMQTAIPGITGFTTTYANVGQTSNKGIEISLQGVLVDKKDLKITAGFNINFNRGNVDELADNVTGLYGTQWASSGTYPTSDYILKVDEPVGLVRGWVYDGFYTVDDFTYADGVYTLKPGVKDIKEGQIYAQLNGIGGRPEGQTAFPGMARYKDVDGDGSIGDEDLTVIGDMTPTHTGGFNLNITWKNFDLGAYFNWSYGNQVYNANKLGTLYNYKESGVYENKLAILNNAFKPFAVENGQMVSLLDDPAKLAAANAGATMPFGYNETAVVSSYGIEDGSYLRLNTLTLGYTLPKRLTKKIGIQNLRIYGSIYNVFTITGYSGLDPEVNTNTAQNKQAYPTVGLDWGAYPRPRSFVVGVNLNF